MAAESGVLYSRARGVPRDGDYVEHRHTRQVQCRWRNAAPTVKASCRQRSGDRREVWKSRETSIASHATWDDVAWTEYGSVRVWPERERAVRRMCSEKGKF